MKIEIQAIHTPPLHLLTEWRVHEFEVDGCLTTRFIGIASHLRTPVLSPPIRRFDPNTACGQDVAGEVWLLLPGDHADHAHTWCEPYCDVTALFVEAVAIFDRKQE
jgi:hypothetical protein